MPLSLYSAMLKECHYLLDVNFTNISLLFSGGMRLSRCTLFWSLHCDNKLIFNFCLLLGCVVAQWVEHMTPGQEDMGLIPASAPFWLGRCKYNVTHWDRSHGLSSVSVRQLVKLSDVSLGSHPPDSLVADKNATKPNKQKFLLVYTMALIPSY